MIDFVVLFSFTELFNDFNFILKIFVLMTVVNFAKNHLGSGPLSWIVVLGMAFFVFGDLWMLFGGAFLLYALLMFGVAGIMIDFFFVSSMGSAPKGGPDPFSPVNSGVDISARMMHARAAGMRRPPAAGGMPMGR